MLHKHLPQLDSQPLTAHAPFRTGVLCIVLAFALGIANIFHLNLLIIFSVILM